MNKISKTKNTLQGINTRLNQTEENINELEEKVTNNSIRAAKKNK